MQVLDFVDKFQNAVIYRNTETGRIRIVGRLASVHVVHWVNNIIFTFYDQFFQARG